MITGAMAPDGGSASFFGIRTLGPLAEADGLDRLRQLLGFCPQHDALLDLLTVRDHLLLFGRLKGVSKQRLPGLVQKLLETLTLEEMALGDADAAAMLEGLALPKLTALKLSGCEKVTVLPDLSGCASLQELNLRYSGAQQQRVRRTSSAYAAPIT